LLENKDQIMGLLLHAIGSLAIVLGIMVHPLLGVLGFLILGFFWEKTQHRYVWGIEEGKLIRMETGWTGWITKHRLIEAAGWPLGALIASIVWMIIK